MHLPESFFNQNTVRVARDLLGKELVRVVNGKTLRGRIVETEAYVGENDSACHASKGITPRTAILFGRSGYAYVYFIYGMHSLLNIVTQREGNPCAVLIRALEPLAGRAIMEKHRGLTGKQLTNGPAKLCQALHIDTSLNGIDVKRSRKLWVSGNPSIPPKNICKGPRIGISYAKPIDQNKAWRFWIKDNVYVSQPKKK